MSINIAIMILGYNSISDLKNGNFDSIVTASQSIKDELVKLVFMDNYSRDGSIEYILEHYPMVDVLMNPFNYLYCDAVNAGLQYIYKRYDPDYYILCDADNRVEEDTFNKLIDSANVNSDAGIIQPLVRSFKDKNVLYSCGHRYDKNHQCWPMTSLPDDISLLNNLPSCSILSTLIRKEIFEQVGILNPVFKIYYESSDMSFRARSKGWRCICDPKSIAYHQGSVGEGINHFHLRFYVNRNWIVFWRLHDEMKYNYVRDYQLKRFQLLQERFLVSPYGLNHTEESIRSGIESGLRIAESLSPNEIRAERIEDFDKSRTILINW